MNSMISMLWIHWFRHYEDYFDRPYDISKQKEFYLAGLKQLIIDEVRIDGYLALRLVLRHVHKMITRILLELLRIT